MSEVRGTTARAALRWTGLAGGPVLAVLVYALLPDAYQAADGRSAALGHDGRITAALAVWMAVWWMSEAIPLYATALLPIAVLPTLGARSVREATTPFAHELIYLFMGGFMLALSMQRWGLDRRIAFQVLRLAGAGPRRMVAAFMAITAVFSMFVSNTATVVMMLPIATSVIRLAGGEDDAGAGPESRHFALCLLLGIAYAASIGGIGTPIGTPPNVFLLSYMKDHLGTEVGFGQWMSLALPLVALFLPCAWLLLTGLLYPIPSGRLEGGAELAAGAARELGPMQRGEWITMLVFGVTASVWIFRPALAALEVAGVRPLAGLTDPGVAILAALALFVIPVDARRRIFVLDWETASGLPWGLLVLFGGGLSLAAAIEDNGVGAYLGAQVGGLAGLSPLVLVLGVASLVILLTELTSNTATTATLVPILAALASGMGVAPHLLVVPAAMAASCAFMLPVATPPNAIVFGSGRVAVADMVRAGVWLNLIGVALITSITFLVALPRLGVEATLR